MEGKKKERKEKKGRVILFIFSVFSLAPSFFSLHLIQLSATITKPTLHGRVTERVREGCGRDTVYRYGK